MRNRLRLGNGGAIAFVFFSNCFLRFFFKGILEEHSDFRVVFRDPTKMGDFNGILHMNRCDLVGFYGDSMRLYGNCDRQIRGEYLPI